MTIILIYTRQNVNLTEQNLQPAFVKSFVGALKVNADVKMATTKRNAMLIDEAREKIRTTQLLNRLQNHALKDAPMSQTQIKATEILLRKRLPDLTATTFDASGSLEEALKAIKVSFGS